MIFMTDLHTHILPGMDDGAPDVQTAVRMLAMEAKQGVHTVALTPHFYRNREHISDYLIRRADSLVKLQNTLKNMKCPKLILSAEVAYAPGMADWEGIDQLCYEGTRILLVEPPVTPWNDEMYHQLYALESRRGLIPMIAHFDRYLSMQTRVHIEKLLDMGFPVQVSTDTLLHFRGRSQAFTLLTEYNGIPVSDCHNLTTRAPDWDAAVKVMERKLGSYASDVLRRTEEFQQW